MFIFEEMLPFTTTQVKNGIDSTDFMLDLSDYAKKKDTVSKSELESLSEVVANKLDATPQHKHHIDDIKQLQSQLDSKYDKNEKYSCSVILNDTEKIPYLEAPKIEVMEIVANKDVEGYKFYVDDSNGDLMIVHNEVLIASYSKASGKWNFNGISGGEVDLTEINNKLMFCEEMVRSFMGEHYTFTSSINENTRRINIAQQTINDYIAKTDAIIKNHYDALLILCQKHGMVDKNTEDGNNITPDKA